MLLEILFLYLASVGSTVVSMVFGHSPIQNMHALTKNVWFVLTGLLFCLICMMVFESPKVPNNVVDIFLCFIYALASASATLCYILCLNYISVLLFTIIISVEIPLLLIAQQTVVKDIGPYSTGPFQICGAILVFLAVGTRPFFSDLFNKISGCQVQHRVCDEMNSQFPGHKITYSQFTNDVSTTLGCKYIP